MLTFDRKLGVYVVVEFSNVYFHNNLYIRFSGDRWEVAAHFDGTWRRAKSKEVPSKLKKTKGKGHPGKGRGRKK